MNSTAQTTAILVALVGSWVWLAGFNLSYYTPQLAAVLALAYFGIRFARKKHLLPVTQKQSSPEFALVSASILLLIGSTGNIDSIFFPLAYLHIFFLTMSLKPFQAVSVSLGVVFFHYILLTSATPQSIAQLVSLFLMLLVFLFAKKQYEENLKQEALVQQQQVKLSDQQSNAVLFIATFLKPKLENLLKLADYPEENKEVITRQIIIIQDAVEQLLEVVNEDTDE